MDFWRHFRKARIVWIIKKIRAFRKCRQKSIENAVFERKFWKKSFLDNFENFRKLKTLRFSQPHFKLAAQRGEFTLPIFKTADKVEAIKREKLEEAKREEARRTQEAILGCEVHFL